MTDTLVRGRARILMLAVGVPYLLTGAWAMLWPRGWFDDYPGIGPDLVAAEPPFNAHLATDAGAGLFAAGIALICAAVIGRRQAAVVGASTALAFGVPHLVFHLTHREHGLSTAGNLFSDALLIGAVVLVLVALVWTRVAPPRHARPMPRPITPARPHKHFRGLRTLVRYVRAFARAKRHRTDFVRWLVRRPQLLAANGMYEAAIMFSNRTDTTLKELGELKAAALISCEFCLDIGSALMHTSGLTEQHVLDLPRYATSDAYTDLEKLVIEFAEAMTRTPVSVSDELREKLLRHLTRGQLAELAATIAWENQRGRVFLALGVRSTGMADGLVCAVPELATR